ncbi:hypothetical protein PUV47_01425 [Pseudovibrio exalbescens]|uniref:GPW/gp25 family protein n=1 Tax=Pseudovibrio exalbescens TaxID=197461 RepID=UPI002365FAE0|nr:GPW/gp25 family protein [Pseudovibrio exalbescens]MDD7908562.1 hypothetical protein [Pseudovibrio exalbescens]
MAGYDAETGKPIYGDARIAQAMRRLVQTRGDLVMRRHLRCELPDLIDTPHNAAQRVLFQAAVATAIHEYEQRVELEEVRLVAPASPSEPEAAKRVADGENRLEVLAVSRETGRPISLIEVVK